MAEAIITSSRLVKNSELFIFVNIGTPESPEWIRVCKGAEDVTNNKEAVTITYQDICDDSEQEEVTGYDETISFGTIRLYTADEATEQTFQDFLYAKYREEAIGDDLRAEVCIVESWLPGSTTDKFLARKGNYNIPINDVATGDQSVQFGAEWSRVGNQETGEFDIVTYEFSDLDAGTETLKTPIEN